MGHNTLVTCKGGLEAGWAFIKVVSHGGYYTLHTFTRKHTHLVQYTYSNVSLCVLCCLMTN